MEWFLDRNGVLTTKIWLFEVVEASGIVAATKA